MGEHKIGQIMKSMATRSGLSASTGKKITNHSSRKTCVQKLKTAGVPRDQIIDVTGHRNVTSLNSYEGDDENQAKDMSNIISGVKRSHPKQPCNPLQSNNSIVNNTFTGSVNFYGGFPSISTLPPQIPNATHRPWKRVKSILTDSDEED